MGANGSENGWLMTQESLLKNCTQISQNGSPIGKSENSKFYHYSLANLKYFEFLLYYFNYFINNYPQKVINRLCFEYFGGLIVISKVLQGR